MAVRKIAFPIALQQNMNSESVGYGSYYPKAVNKETLSLQGLLNMVAFDQSVYSKDIVAGVVDKLTTTMVELLKEGQSVKWDKLGTFTPNIESEKGGATEAMMRADGFNVEDLIAGVHIRFIPENSKGQALTSRKFKDVCQLKLVGVLKRTTYGEGTDAVKMTSLQTIDEFRKANGE